MNTIRFVSFFLSLAQGAFAAEAPVYRATAGNHILILKTPYGTKTLIGDQEFAKLKSYRFSIPLDDLKPAPIQLVLNAVPATAPEAAKDLPSTTSAGAAPAPSSSESSQVVAPPEEKSEDAIAETVDRQVDRALARANRLYNLRKFLESEDMVDEVLEIHPGSIRAWMMKGSLLKLKGKSKEAEEAWEKARSLDPSRREVPVLMEGGSV
jgi:hypothetical protein